MLKPLNNKKKTCIPPILHENKFILDFKQEAEIFNSFFANQCTPIHNNSKLLLELIKKTHHALSTVNFLENDAEKL